MAKSVPDTSAQTNSRIGRALPTGTTLPFSPLHALQPAMAPVMAGRKNDFQVGYNLVVTPGASGEAYTPAYWDMLRRMASSYPPLTMVMQTQVDKISSLPWKVKPKKDKKATKQTERLNVFFNCPDGEHSLQEWLRLILWEMLTTDATCIYPRFYDDGALHSLQVRDGTTIKVLIDDWGDRPTAPEPAYQQVIKGRGWTDYTADELIYKPRNIRVNQIYGWSPVAQIVSTVSLAMLRMTQQLNFFQEGSVPDAFASCPESWTTQQIKDMQMYWDVYMAGNLAARSGGLRFIPFGLKPEPFKLDPMLKQEFDEWVMRLICYQFGEAPQPFIKEMARSTAETNKSAADEGGLKTRIAWVQELVNFILVKYLGDTDHEFGLDIEQNLTANDAAVIASTLHKGLPSDILTKNEARKIVGQDPIEGGDEISKAPDPLELAKINAAAKPEAPEKGEKKLAVPEKKEAPKPAAKEVKKSECCHDIEKALPITPEEKSFADMVEGLLSLAGDRASSRAASLFESLAVPASDAPFLPSAWFDMLLEDITPHLFDAAKVGVDLGANLISEAAGSPAGVEAIEVAGKGAAEWATERAAFMVGKSAEGAEAIREAYRIDGMMREAISSKVQQAIAESWSTAKLQYAIVDDFAFSPARALSIARTELGNGQRAGQLEIYRAAGIPLKAWDLADGACAACQENVAVGAIPLGQAFPNGNSVHPNDRCGIRPVMEARK